MATHNDTKAACKIIESKMNELEAIEREHERKEREHASIKLSARAKRMNFKELIHDLDPFYQFTSSGTVELTGMSATTKLNIEDSLESSHKENYGRWVRIARQVLRLAGGGGTFSSLRDTARGHGLVSQDTSDQELEALRGALHGLARRKVIVYTPGEGAGGGRFNLRPDDHE